MSAHSQLDPLAGVLFENSFLGVLITSNGSIERANEHVIKMLGYSEKELKERKLEQLLIITDSSIGSAEDLIESATKHVVRAHVESKDSNVLPVDISVTRFKSQDGEKSAVLLCDAQTSELIEELKREFITKVSTDLRSPLTAISGSLAILKSERMAKLSDSVRNVVTIAERNCKRLILMVNEILDLESLERGNIRLQPRKADLKEILGQAVEMVSAFCDETSVSVDANTKDLPIQGDEERLTQVFANILRNAIKSSKKGGKIEILTSNEHGWAEVKVRYTAGEKQQQSRHDDGISDALAQRSLEVCKEVIALHKGYFGSEDAENSVKFFWVRIPLLVSSK